MSNTGKADFPQIKDPETGVNYPIMRPQEQPLSTDIDQAFSAMATDETYQRESVVVRESMDRLSTSGQEIAPDDRKYPCMDCQTMRSEAEGGKIFSVCEECWDKRYPKPAHSPAVQALESQPPDVERLGRMAIAMRDAARRVREWSDLQGKQGRLVTNGECPFWPEYEHYRKAFDDALETINSVIPSGKSPHVPGTPSRPK